ncbi:MAG: ATP-dependent Clp protease proteolytic subunit [Chloroflexi bacterium]|uniref:ATP-dependent Clp protease proteolytic subunit n=1 Tax=Candidatus Flexifilum breve TaxID=3140694 RepID=UPI0031358FC1|nr:ATP-dependent Clp protease proteolytic subunit [Chloroflexota bacterium]
MQGSSVLGRYYEDRYVVTLIGPIHDESILNLCIEINEAVNYYYYTLIEIEIASQGGEVSALEYFLDHLHEWRQSRRVQFATKALTTAVSAAAIILSMGDPGLRRAHGSSSLLYHEIRIVNQGLTVMDRGALARAEKQLQRVNESLVARLTEHIYTTKIMAETVAGGDYRWKTMPALKSDFRQPNTGMLSDADFTEITCGSEPHLTYQQLLSIYQDLFALDIPISPALATKMALIDTVLGEGRTL